MSALSATTTSTAFSSCNMPQELEGEGSSFIPLDLMLLQIEGQPDRFPLAILCARAADLAQRILANRDIYGAYARELNSLTKDQGGRRKELWAGVQALFRVRQHQQRERECLKSEFAEWMEHQSHHALLAGVQQFQEDIATADCLD